MTRIDVLWDDKEIVATRFLNGVPVRRLRQEYKVGHRDVKEVLQIVLGDDVYEKIVRRKRTRMPAVSIFKELCSKEVLDIHSNDFVEKSQQLIRRAV